MPNIVEQWLRVSRAQRCPICESDSYCVLAADGNVVLCMRIESQKPAPGKAGGWIHRLSDPLKVEIKPRRKKEPVAQAEWQARAERAYEHPRAAQTRERLATELGLQAIALEQLLVGYGWDEFRSLEFSTWPERNGQLKVLGIIRRYWQPVKDGGNKLLMEGAKHGLYLRRDWWTTPSTIYLVEGGTDTAALIGLGVCAIGRPSNVGGVNLLIGLLMHKRNRRLVVVGENDEKPHKRGLLTQCPTTCTGCMHCWPGKAGAKRTAEALTKALGVRVKWFVPDTWKDARAWLIESSGDRTLWQQEANRLLRR